MSVGSFARLQEFLNSHANHQAGGGKIAVFDCDGTVIKGDIGEAMLYYQIEHFLFRRSPADTWEDYPDRKELDRRYHALHNTAPEIRSGHPEFGPFADMVLSWYFDQIAADRVAKACADIVRLLAGFTLAEVRAIANSTFLAEHGSPVTKRRLGTRTLPRGIRFIKECTDLVQQLQERGFVIWAVSGSNKWSVEPVFQKLGVPPAHVIGIELLEENGRLSASARQPVPIREKKVDALKEHVPARPLIVASDSRNDIPLLLYASEVRVYVNSHRRDPSVFFTSGRVVRDRSWVVIDSPTLEE